MITPSLTDRILVTGATGLLGSHVIRELLTHGYDNIVAMKRSSSSMALISDVHDRVEWWECDLLDLTSLDDPGVVDAIIHCAALISYDPRDRDAMERVNVEGTKSIIELAHRKSVKRLIHVSSIAAVGASDDGNPVDEKALWNYEAGATSAYSVTKFYAEQEMWRAHVEGLSVLIACPSVILGAGDWTQGSASIPHRVAAGLLYYPSGSTGYVDVHDVASILRKMLSLTTDGERYIVSAHNASYKYVLENFARALGASPPTRELPLWMHSVLPFLSRIRQLISGDSPITRTLLQSMSQVRHYSDSKLQRDIGHDYRPLIDTIDRIAKAYGEAHK